MDTITTRAQELRREYARQWRQKNRDKVKAYNEAWRKKHPEKAREYQARYWERRANADLETLRNAIDEEQGGN